MSFEYRSTLCVTHVANRNTEHIPSDPNYQLIYQTIIWFIVDSMPKQFPTDAYNQIKFFFIRSVRIVLKWIY